jgi:uncharacterized protein DUF3738
VIVLHTAIATAQQTFDVASVKVFKPGSAPENRTIIAAKTDDSATQDQLMLMLQTLLAQRFKLSLHRKTEQRPALDGTRLTGVYDINLRVELDDPQARLPQPGQAFTGFGMTPGVFTALEELGLKLNSQKGPVDTLVVDHVERPSPN